VDFPYVTVFPRTQENREHYQLEYVEVTFDHELLNLHLEDHPKPYCLFKRVLVSRVAGATWTVTPRCRASDSSWGRITGHVLKVVSTV
jgi:hypothetical protein